MNCNNDSFTKYDKKNENGWYLLVWNKETKKNAERFEYIKIKKFKMENITTTALKYLKKEGLFYTVDPKDILKYEITLLYYHKKEVTSRYIMKYKENINAIDGFYDDWEYTVKNKNGEFETFDKSYSYLKAYNLPLIIFLFQLFCIVCTYKFPVEITKIIRYLTDSDNYSKSYDLFDVLVTFLMFYSALIYSTFSIMKKESIKPHFLKENLKRIIFSTFIFEIPIVTGAISTVWKINVIVGKSEPFDVLFWCSVILMLMKIGFTILLEIEKKQK
ncbi:hypothetical protein [Bacillus thuringiensis]|uniref:hypothetical protein n=1 Tax=Bacillus thuringiensis TaxID=1428 RepID=UPI000BF977A3|nr:hypothetical protein [Bacillus thuringiensis]PFU61946.1 hypothetical protein COK85_10015 [Bacillus thuringiensis]